ncbi:MAG: glycoside hydrolase family 13 protein [Flavobacteriaceae bacterium]|nr:glycoside hydrolase family 13 protein [Flavobacteriaceae bacterium]
MKYKPFLLLLIFASQIAFAQFERVEPPFWWKDMQMSQIQLMIYGKNIANYQLEIPNVQNIQIEKTENKNYLFVTVETKNLNQDSFIIRLKKGRKTIDSYTYELKERRPGSATRKGFDASDAIYLLMPDRFANGDPGNDSHPEMAEKADRSYHGGRHGGDIQGIINNLDYIENLGMTAIWSTPMLADNDDKYSYHTYAQSDVYRIDPRYGTNALYRKLGAELHKRDMKLIMDYVTNHWGITHWMIQDLPTYDWIHQFPGYANSNYRMTTQYDPNFSERDKKYCEDGWFVSTMPDLNQRHPLVLQYLIQNAIWWIEYADLDGFRVDTYSYNDKEAIAKWTAAIMQEYPNFNIVGEVWLHDQAQIAYWQKDSKIGALQNYNSHCPAVMDFTLHDAIMEVFHEEKATWTEGLIKVYENMVNDFLYPDTNQLLIFAENHDTPRINQLYPDIADYKLIMTLLATHRGIPQLYYGSAIGMQGKKEVGDGDIRRDFPGGWDGDTQNAFDPIERTAKQKEYFEHTATLFQWRKNQKVIHSGKTKQFIPENNVFVYFRYHKEDVVMVVINNNIEDQEIDLRRFREILPTQANALEVISGQNTLLEDSIAISAKSSKIFQFKNQ